MRSTLRALVEAGLVHAGTRDNLALARSPAYLDTPKGCVALVAVASTFTEGSQAGEQRPAPIGRPGVNPLRFTTTCTVDPEVFRALKKVVALVYERYSLEISGVFENVMNHLDFSNPSLSLHASSSWGVTKTQGNTPRQIQMGIRASF